LAGVYREDIVTEAGKTVRKRIAVNLGSLKDVPGWNRWLQSKHEPGDYDNQNQSKGC